MTLEEIFSELAAHMIKGLMIHDQMQSYYCFLSLKEYARCHKEQYREESEDYLRLKKHYFKYHNRLIKERSIDNPNLIPKSWYNYERRDVDGSTKRNAVKTGFEEWIRWEQETKELYQKMYKELIMLNEINDACFIKELTCCVEHELAKAEKKYIKLKTLDFSIDFILMDQEEK